MSNSKNSRFARSLFKTSPVYKCRCCGKMTRETGEGEESCDLCAFCYLEGGIENSYSDNGGARDRAVAMVCLRDIEGIEARYKRTSAFGDSLRAELKAAVPALAPAVESDQVALMRSFGID